MPHESVEMLELDEVVPMVAAQRATDRERGLLIARAQQDPLLAATLRQWAEQRDATNCSGAEYRVARELLASLPRRRTQKL